MVQTEIYRIFVEVFLIKNRMKSFNTTGPCDPQIYYMLSPEERLVGAGLSRYIDEQLYWVLHAPRQTGKTTFLINWMRELNASDKYVACYVSVERCQGITEVERSMPALYEAICKQARTENLPVPKITTLSPASLVNRTLEKWAKLVQPKPFYAKQRRESTESRFAV
jgi:hypothetical protein